MKGLFKKLSVLGCLVASSSVFAEAAQEAAKPRQQNYLQTILMLVVALVFFYFILLRPEQKRRKKLEKQRSSLQKGSKVTAMGIVGTVDRINEKTIVLKMVDGSKIEVLKQAVTDVESPESSSSEKSEDKPQEKPSNP